MNPSFTSILVSVTEGCHVGCAHCGFIGSNRDRETDPHELVDWVKQACAYGIPAIIFTGGEPFERFEVLRQGVLAANRHATPSCVFTSSFWATSVETAVATLSELSGLSHLYLSTDTFHQRRVPYEYVHNVIAAADRVKIREITLCITYASEQDRQAVRQNYESYGQRLRFYESRVIPTPFIGKALRGQDAMLDPQEKNFGSTCWLKTPIINPNGDLFSCHAGKVGAHGNMEGLPYWLGNLRRDSFLSIMETARRKVEYQYLRTHGPKGVARLFQEYPELASAVGRDGFSGPCDMCFAALSTPEGRKCLKAYSHRPEVLQQINLRLALQYREPPLDLDLPRPVKVELT
jgi:MoaA/NifB/PqqE/SkfB family radical SAM enzyme